MNSRRKGKGAELEVAKLIRDQGFSEARRGVQYCGINGDADVVGLPGCYVEVKRRQRGSIYEWLKVAAIEAQLLTPVVFHRRDSQGIKTRWAVTLYAEDFLEILHAAEYGCKDVGGEK